MKLRIEPPEKKKKRKTKNSSPPPPSPPSFSSLPDEIAVNCLARIPRPYYPRLSIVSKSFCSLLSSTELYAERSHIGSTEQCLYVCLWDPRYQFPQWFVLWINPNRTLPNSSITNKKKKIGKLLVPIPPSDSPSVSNSTTVVVGSEIYVIGGSVEGAPSSAVRILDCRSHTWREAPSMNVARKKAYSCVYNGKIYVVGGCEDEPWGEVFDTKIQTWERLPDPGTRIHRFPFYKIKEIEGKIYVWNSYTEHAYDPIQRKWECYEGWPVKFPMSECVMDSVWYSYGIVMGLGRYNCKWYDIKNRQWEEVNGLESLGVMYERNGGSSHNTTKLVSCNGTLTYLLGKVTVSVPNIRRRRFGARKSFWKNVMEVRFGERLSGSMLWIQSPYHVSSCIVSPYRFD